MAPPVTNTATQIATWIGDIFGLNSKDNTILIASGLSFVVVLLACAAMLYSFCHIVGHCDVVCDSIKIYIFRNLKHVFKFLRCQCLCGAWKIRTDAFNFEAHAREQLRKDLRAPLLQSSSPSSRAKQEAEIRQKAQRDGEEKHAKETNADHAMDDFAVTTRVCMVIILLGFFIQVMSHVRADSEMSENVYNRDDSTVDFKVYPTIQMAIHKSSSKNLLLYFVPVGFAFLFFARILAEHIRLRKKEEKKIIRSFKSKGHPLDDKAESAEEYLPRLRCKAPRCEAGKGKLGCCIDLECPSCKGDSRDFEPKEGDHVYINDAMYYPEHNGRCGVLKMIKEGSETLSHRVDFTDDGSVYGWFRRNALVLACVVDDAHYIRVREPAQLSGRYYRDPSRAGAYVMKREDAFYEMLLHQRRWFWGERGGQVWFTSFEQSLLPPIPIKAEPEDNSSVQFWQPEVGAKERLAIDFDVYYACRAKISTRATQDKDFKAHINKMYKHSQYAQTSSHKRLTSNTLFFQVACLLMMWFFPTCDFLPCSFSSNYTDSNHMPAINWTELAIKAAHQVKNFTYEPEDLPGEGATVLDFEIFSCKTTQWKSLWRMCGTQTRYNTLAWHLLNLSSLFTAMRALWIQGLVSLEKGKWWAPLWEGYKVDPLTYFIALMQIVGVVCYVFFLHGWKDVRCRDSQSLFFAGSNMPCTNFCNHEEKMKFRDESEKLDFGPFFLSWRIGTRIWQETSMIFAVLAMFCRVCRDYAVYKGVWQQRYSIFIPFALLMLHSLVTQNSLVIMPGVAIFVAATFQSASIGKI